jgi:hypothetical protein
MGKHRNKNQDRRKHKNVTGHFGHATVYDGGNMMNQRGKRAKGKKFKKVPVKTLKGVIVKEE